MKKFVCMVGILLLASTLHADDEYDPNEVFSKCLKGDNQACKKFLIKSRVRCNQNNESGGCSDLASTYSYYKHLFYPNISEYEALKNHLRLQVKACMLGLGSACEKLEEKKMELEPYSGDFYTVGKIIEKLLDLQKANYLFDEAIAKSKGNLGLAGTANNSNAEFEILHQNAVKAFGRSQKGGRLSNQDERQLEKYYGLGAMRDNYYEKVFVIKQKLVEDMYQELIALQKQGQRISDDDIKEYELARQSLNEMKKQINALNSGKAQSFDYKLWNDKILTNRRAYE